jgi:hypothetical protein
VIEGFNRISAPQASSAGGGLATRRVQRACLTAMVMTLGGAGCSSNPSAIEAPSFSPAKAAHAAIEKYDRDGDARLQQSEWSQCPALAASIEIYDVDDDDAISEDELGAGMRRWQEGEMGARPLPFQVKLGGKPVQGARVELIPEDFFGDAVMPASGVSGQGGRGFLGVALEDLPPNAPKLPLTQPGLYRVEITHPSVAIPPKYNDESTLGIEVADDIINPRGVVWDLAR